MVRQGRGALWECREKMTPYETEKVQLLLADDGPGKIHADLEAFFEFSFYMAEELEDLVAIWSHRAAPNARRPQSPRR